MTEVVADDALGARADELCGSLAQGPTNAYGSVKRLLNETFTNTLETQMQLESRCFVENTHTEDGREGIRAFVEKRKPSFQGR